MPVDLYAVKHGRPAKLILFSVPQKKINMQLRTVCWWAGEMPQQLRVHTTLIEDKVREPSSILCIHILRLRTGPDISFRDLTPLPFVGTMPPYTHTMKNKYFSKEVSINL